MQSKKDAWQTELGSNKAPWGSLGYTSWEMWPKTNSTSWKSFMFDLTCSQGTMIWITTTATLQVDPVPDSSFRWIWNLTNLFWQWWTILISSWIRKKMTHKSKHHIIVGMGKATSVLQPLNVTFSAVHDAMFVQPRKTMQRGCKIYCKSFSLTSSYNIWLILVCGSHHLFFWFVKESVQWKGDRIPVYQASLRAQPPPSTVTCQQRFQCIFAIRGVLRTFTLPRPGPCRRCLSWIAFLCCWFVPAHLHSSFCRNIQSRCKSLWVIKVPGIVALEAPLTDQYKAYMDSRASSDGRLAGHRSYEKKHEERPNTALEVLFVFSSFDCAGIAAFFA